MYNVLPCYRNLSLPPPPPPSLLMNIWELMRAGKGGREEEGRHKESKRGW